MCIASQQMTPNNGTPSGANMAKLSRHGSAAFFEAASSLAEDFGELQKAFAFFDKDGNGTISQDELGSVFRTMGNNITDTVLESMFDEVDIDRSGVIDVKEFLTLLQSWSKHLTALRCKLTGFWRHCANSGVMCVTSAALGILCLSSMGWGSSCLNALREVGEYWWPLICVGVSIVMVLVLYLFDFFMPPHLPERRLALYERDPGVGIFLFGTALVLFFVGNLPMAVAASPHRPMLMTLYLAPVGVMILGIRARAHTEFIQRNMGQAIEEKGSALEIELYKVVKDIALEDDDGSFFKANMLAFVGAGFACLAAWIPWAVFQEVPESSDNSDNLILWVTPMVIALAMLVLGGIVAIRVQVHGAYTWWAFEDSSADMKTPSGSTSSRRKAITNAIQSAEMRQLHKMRGMKSTLKTMVAVCLFVLGLTILISNFAFRDSQIASMTRDLLTCLTISFVVFIALAFSQLVQEIQKELAETALWKSLMRLLSSDWTRALGISFLAPLIFAFLVLSIINQQVRRCRGLHHERVKGALRKSCRDMQNRSPHAAKGLEWFTERTRKVVFQGTSWPWISVGIKVHVVCTFLIVLMLGPLGFNILFAFIIDRLRPLKFWWTVSIVAILGIVALLIPTVPTTTVYMFGGVVITEKWKSLPSSYGGFWAGVCFCVILSLLVKLVGRLLQYHCFGKILGKSIRVQHLCKVHSPIMRTVALMMAEPGICRLGKVSVLCGVPDWPMGVGAGILGFPILHVIIGTVPIVFFVIPCVMIGSCYIRRNEGDTWDNVFMVMVLASGVVSVIFQALAAYSVQLHFGRNIGELEKPCPTHAELHWRDYCNSEVLQAQHVDWHQVPGCLQVLGATSAVAQVSLLHTFWFGWDLCFGEFAITDDIKNLRWHGNGAVIFPLGVVCLIALAASIIMAMCLQHWVQRRNHSKCTAVREKLATIKDEWVQNWVNQADLEETDSQQQSLGLEPSSARTVTSAHTAWTSQAGASTSPSYVKDTCQSLNNAPDAAAERPRSRNVSASDDSSQISDNALEGVRLQVPKPRSRNVSASDDSSQVSDTALEGVRLQVPKSPAITGCPDSSPHATDFNQIFVTALQIEAMRVSVFGNIVDVPLEGAQRPRGSISLKLTTPRSPTVAPYTPPESEAPPSPGSFLSTPREGTSCEALFRLDE